MVDRVAILGLGAACIVPSLGLVWQSSSLRGDIFSKWVERVDIAYAGLSELAVYLLRQLQSETDRLLGNPEAGVFTDLPSLVIEDPGPLVKLTRKFDRAITARKKLRRRFHLLVRMCAVAPFLAGAFSVGSALAVLHYGRFVQHLNFDVIGLYTCGISLGLGALVVTLYSYLNWCLASAEILAHPGRD